MFKKKKIDAGKLAKFIPAKIQKVRAPKYYVNRCRDCGICQNCANAFYDETGKYIVAIAREIRRHYGASLDNTSFLKTLKEMKGDRQPNTVETPYQEDVATILAACSKLDQHPILYVEYAHALISSKGFDLKRDLTMLMPWNMERHFSDYVDEKQLRRRLKKAGAESVHPFGS